MSISSTDHTIYQRPVELLQNLIRFDTTNPPGREIECVTYVAGLLKDAGFDTTFLAKDPDRPNLTARLAGRGDAPPLLLYGHVDVVTTASQNWTHPPFEGRVADDYVWGRGALDMKGGVAMMVAAFLRAKAEGFTPAGDVVLAILSDEEGGGDFGAKYLVNEHPEQFEGIRYALGEFGGFPMYVGGKKFYAIQVGEKQVCWTKATVRGPAGHGSFPMQGGAMSKLGQILRQLDQSRLPVHVTPIVEQMLTTMADNLAAPMDLAFRQLLDPDFTDEVLDQLGERGYLFDPMLHNTVNATIVRGGEKVNVIPGQIELELDGRSLPGFGPDELFAELRGIIGDDVELEVVRYDPGPAEPDMSWFDTLAGILREADPDAICVPFLVPGATDARFFSKLGIQTYGFLPMNLPADFNFLSSIHAADERIPVESVEFGTEAVYRALQQYSH